MSRVQQALNVDDLNEAVTFYSKLFNAQPAKVKPGYANFAIAEPPLKLVLLENPGKGGTINHLGVEVGSSDDVHAEIARLTAEGLFTDQEIGTTCCFATQDKVWVTGPAGEKWEVYTVLADSETFGTSPQHESGEGEPSTSLRCERGGDVRGPRGSARHRHRTRPTICGSSGRSEYWIQSHAAGSPIRNSVPTFSMTLLVRSPSSAAAATETIATDRKRPCP